MKRSSNTPTKLNMVKSNKIPEGDNISSGDLPFESDGQAAFGTGNYGKVEHFNAVQKPKVNH